MRSKIRYKLRESDLPRTRYLMFRHKLRKFVHPKVYGLPTAGLVMYNDIE